MMMILINVTDVVVREMCGGRIRLGGLGSTLHKGIQGNYCQKKSGMEFESDWTKHRKSSILAAEAIRSATAFMPWCCKIPIGEGYHEFL